MQELMQLLCLGQTVQLTATGADTYEWTPATGLSDANIFNPTAEPTTSTEYVVEGTDINGVCKYRYCFCRCV